MNARMPRSTIHRRLMALGLGVLLLVVLIVYGLVLPMVGREKYREREAMLSAIVDSMLSLMWHYETAVRTQAWQTDPALPRTREEARLRMAEAMRHIRYENDEYLFILDGSARMVMHPLKPGLEGQDMATVRSPDGDTPFASLAIEAQRSGTTWVHYTWLSKWSQTVYEPQTVCAKYFYPWDWVVCAGVYTQDIEDAVRSITWRTTLYLMLGLAAGAVALSGVSLLITGPIVRLSGEVHTVADHLDKPSFGDISVTGPDEVGDLADSCRRLVGRLREVMTGLRESEENLRITLDSIGDGVIATDMAGRIVRMNPVAEQLTGWSLAEALGRPLPEVFDIYSATSGEACHNPFEKVRGTGGIVGLANHTMLRSRDGREYQIADSGAPIRGADNRMMGVVIVFRDVTQQYAMEEQLRQRQKMDAIGELAGGIAHDFNNMLGGILGGVELLDDDVPKTSEASEYVALIRDAATRAAELTGKLLLFARRGAVTDDVADVHKAVRDAVDLLRHSLDKCVRIDMHLEADQACVQGNHTQLQNVFINLGLNAGQAMVPAGGVLAFRSRTITLDGRDTTGLHAGAYLELLVEDTGRGIAPENMAHIFEPFFTTRTEGTGMGLPAAYGTVRAHGGDIQITSTPGKGTVCRVLLPLTDRECPASAAEPVCVRGTGTILLVDDEQVIRRATGGILEQLGYHVIQAANGPQALEILAQPDTAVDLVILDVIMPDMNGRDCFKAIRARAPGLPVIFSSGFTRDDDLEDLLGQDGVSFIGKPCRKAELSQVVAAMLTGSGQPPVQQA